MPTSPSATPGRRLLAVVTGAAALTLAGLLAVTDAHGSTAPAPSTPAPSASAQRPSAPTGFTATTVRANSVTFTWTASQPGCCPVTGYDITWNEAFDDIYRATPAGSGTTFTLTGLRAAAQYTFRVHATDSSGQSSLSSAPVTVVTPLSDSGADTVPPQAPAGLTVTGESATEASLSWSPSTDNTAVTGYNVYWYDGWFSSRLVATVSGTSYTAALTATRNVFYVRARDAAGNVSIASNTVTVNSTGPTSPPPSSSPPPPPPACRVTYENTSQWDRGFVAALTITNTGKVPLDGWTLGFTFDGDQKITSAWNATYAQDGPAVTLRNAHWNGSLAPGAVRTAGLLGTWTTAAPAPTAFTLNGVPCAAG
ncbi:cellulose binding domain-containing protein [Actinoplanes sp. NBC_00393]|uniref:cellulose binding domain-containing protein n=1 Tax=Actinoplanes sp. NBC_00393 TaxID=2975953 RepID=UPI002E2278FB